MFLELLQKYQQQYGIRLFSYVLLPGHLHLLLEMAGDDNDVSGFMHDLNNSYTKYYNGRYERKGHLFRGRFKAAVVEKAPNLAKLTAYMHLNPKRLDLVDNARDYPYSSYANYLNPQTGLNPQQSIQFDFVHEINEVLRLLQDKGYEDFVQELFSEEQVKLHKRLQRGGGIVGSPEFVEMIKQEIEKLKSPAPIQSSVAGQPKYRFFVAGAGFLVLVIVGLGGLYFYYANSDKPKVLGEHKIIVPTITQPQDLDSTEWQVKLTPVSGATVKTDTLSFVKGKFISAEFDVEGYTSSNYSLSVEESGKIVWETMQTGPLGTASWRGEITGNKMQGVLSLRQEGNESQDFSFISINYRRKK